MEAENSVDHLIMQNYNFETVTIFNYLEQTVKHRFKGKIQKRYTYRKQNAAKNQKQ